MSAATKTKRTYACGMCFRELPHERWVFSTHTSSRYCWPGEGCQKPKRKKTKGASA